MVVNAAILILLATAINRARGDDRWKPAWLPGRALFYCGIMLGLASLLVAEPRIALAWGVAYLIWGGFAWGHWFDLGRLPDNYGREPPKGLERIIHEWAGGNDHIALFLRHLIFALPALGLVSFGLWSWVPLALTVPFAALIVGGYELGWRLTPKQPIRTAELLTGALWGALIGGVHYVV